MVNKIIVTPKEFAKLSKHVIVFETGAQQLAYHPLDKLPDSLKKLVITEIVDYENEANGQILTQTTYHVAELKKFCDVYEVNFTELINSYWGVTAKYSREELEKLGKRYSQPSWIKLIRRARGLGALVRLLWLVGLIPTFALSFLIFVVTFVFRALSGIVSWLFTGEDSEMGQEATTWSYKFLRSYTNFLDRI